jgi:sulfate permease, SulP family
MVALGVANIGSGFLRGLAAGGSLSQSAVNDGAGARTEMSTIVAWVLAVVTVIALTPLFTDLPEAVLAALIIHAVSHLMKVGEMRRFYRLMPREFWLAMLTLLSVITLDVLLALMIGVGLSIVLLVYRASRPRLSPLGAGPTHPGAYEDLERHPDATPVAGVLIVRPDAPVSYANAQAIQDGVAAMAAGRDGPISAVLIDLDANDHLDITSVEALTKLVTNLHRRGLASAWSTSTALRWTSPPVRASSSSSARIASSRTSTRASAGRKNREDRQGPPYSRQAVLYRGLVVKKARVRSP